MTWPDEDGSVPLGYHAPGAPRRPLGRTAMAVASLAVGALSILVNLGLSLEALVHYRLPPQPPAEPAGVFALPAMDQIAPDGLPDPNRQIILSALGDMRRLSDQRRDLLDGFLADVGQMVFASPLPTTQADVRRMVRQSGRLPGAMGAEGADFWQFEHGRLEVSDRNAVFYPASGIAIRGPGGSFRTDDGKLILSPNQVQAVIQRIRHLADHALTDAQEKALKQVLGQAGQQLILPSSSVAGAVRQVGGVEVHRNGSITVYTASNSLTFSRRGQLSGAGGSTQSVRMLAGMAMGKAMVSIVLAVLLMIAGLLTWLGQGPHRALHWIYVAIKTPLSIAAAIVWAMLYTQLARHDAATIWLVSVALAIGGCAYPVVAAIMLRRMARSA